MYHTIIYHRIQFYFYMKKLTVIVPIFIGIAAVHLIGCGGGSKKESEVKKDSIVQKTYDINPDKAIGLGRVEPEMKIVKIYPEVSGVVEVLNVKAGAEVKKGQVLAQLSHALEDAKVVKTKAQFESQNAQIQGFDTQIQTQNTQIAGFEKEIAKALVGVEFAQKNFDRYEKAFKEGAETKATLDNAESQLRTAQAEVERLMAQQNNLRAQVNNLKAQQANLKAQVSALRADQNVAEVERNRREILSVADGKMLSVDITLGSYVSTQTPLGDFAPTSPTNVVAEIDELFANKVAIGQTAKIRLQGSADVITEGKVIDVSAYLKQKSLFSEEIGKLEDRRVREVRVRLENPPASLLYGTRVECVIQLK